MFISFGTNARPARKVWMSILIFCGICAFSTFWNMRAQSLKNAFFNTSSYIKTLELQNRLTKEFCQLQRMSESNCQQLELLVSSKNPFETNSISNAQSNLYRVKANTVAKSSALKDKNLDPKDEFLLLISNGPQAGGRIVLTPHFYQSYLNFDQSRSKSRSDYLLFLKSNHFAFSRFDSLVNFLQAHFLFRNWTLLIANLVFFLAFSVFIESRLGAVPTLLIYLSGGSIGLLLQTRFLIEGENRLIGASSCISAILGAILVLFWRQKINVWIGFFKNRRGILIPAAVILPSIAVTLFVLESFDSFSKLDLIIHIAGFSSGMVFAKIFAFMDPTSTRIVFENEAKYFRAFQNEVVIRKKILALKKLFRNYPESQLGIEKGCEWALQEIKKNFEFMQEHLDFVSALIGKSVNEQLKHLTKEEVTQYLLKLPVQLNYSLVCKSVPVAIQLAVQNEWLNNKKYALSLDDYFEIESRLNENQALQQFDKIITSIDLDLSQISNRERTDIVNVYEKYRKLYPEHILVKKLALQVMKLKERSYLTA